MAKRKKTNFKKAVQKNTAKQKSNESSYGYLLLSKGISVFKEKPGGKHTLDFMPYVVSDVNHIDGDKEEDMVQPDSLWYKRPFYVHRGVGSDNESLVCPSTFGGKCPICDYRKKRMKDGADRDETNPLRPSPRNLYVVIPIGDSKHDEKPHIWDVSQYLFQKLLNTELEEDFDNAVFPDLEEGLSLKIRFDKETFAGNEFAKASRIDFKERDEAYDEDILNDIPDLDKMLKVLPYKEIEKLFLEIDVPEAGEEEEDEQQPEVTENEAVQDAPKKKKRKKKTAEVVEEAEEAPEEVALTYKDVQEMEFAELCEAADANVEDFDVDDYDEDDEDDITALREEIVDALGLEKPKKAAKKKAVKKEEKPAKKEKKKAAKKSTKKECPHGYTFGEDVDEHDECDECPLWDACIDAADE